VSTILLKNVLKTQNIVSKVFKRAYKLGILSKGTNKFSVQTEKYLLS